jgi:SAM-dependent methyltransferase
VFVEQDWIHNSPLLDTEKAYREVSSLIKTYWNDRYTEGRIWGDDACPSAVMAYDHFSRAGIVDVLVPGCGYGRNSLFFAKQGFHVTAFDVSDVAVGLAGEQAQENVSEVKYLVGDVFDPEFLAGEQFDGIYLSNVLHLFLATEREKLLRRITSFLRSGGLFTFSCISVFDTNNYGIGPEIEPNTFEKHEGKPLHFFNEAEIQKMLSADYRLLERRLHVQTESDPSGQSEDLQLWFVAAKKL